MKKRIATFAALLWLVATVGFFGQAPTAVAQGHDGALPGMCNGRTDANLVVNAHANGIPNSVPKYILNVSSDNLKNVVGTLVVGQGSDRLEVTDWCRLWQHRAGDPYGGHEGQCDDGGEQGEDHGSVNVHAVGITSYQGQSVLVRTDVRESDEGLFFRVRYRALQHGGDGCGGDGGCEGEVTSADDGCEDGEWTRVPSEGWYALDQLKVRRSSPS